MKFDRRKLDQDTLIHLYKSMLKPRMIEEKMLKLLRQGKVSKWFAGIGQEAIAVGATSILKPEEYILPMHRNLGVFTSRNIPLKRLFLQWQGKEGGFTKGRDRSFHFGTQEFNIVGMISHLGPQLGVADGIALAARLKKSPAFSTVKARCRIQFRPTPAWFRPPRLLSQNIPDLKAQLEHHQRQLCRMPEP